MLASVATPSETRLSSGEIIKGNPNIRPDLKPTDLKPHSWSNKNRAKKRDKNAPDELQKHERAVSHVRAHIARSANYIVPRY